MSSFYILCIIGSVVEVYWNFSHYWTLSSLSYMFATKFNLNNISFYTWGMYSVYETQFLLGGFKHVVGR
jgi:hypothetical protein